MTSYIKEILCLVFVLLLWLMSLFCGCKEEEIDETKIMNTICDEGVLKISVINGIDCYYHAIERDGEKISCHEETGNKMQGL